MPKQSTKRAIIFANGLLNNLDTAREIILEEDLLIAADGGARHCLKLGFTPNILIGDFDSLNPNELVSLQSAGTEIIRHPAQKDYTDLELALRHAQSLGVVDILVMGALGARWDQTIANLLLPVTADLSNIHIRLVDGPQEVMLLRGGDTLSIHGQDGDIISLIPLGVNAYGVTTHGLEYPLDGETLYFGATRGVSNVLINEVATIQLKDGLLLCVVIHIESTKNPLD